MESINKGFAVFVILIMAISSLSLMVVKPTNAQSITKPSVPEFTVKYIDNSYDVPPTYETDQYTGKTIVTHNGYHVDNSSIELRIKNQPFISYNDSNGNQIRLYYNFRYKGAYTNTWTYYPENSNGKSVIHYNGGLGNDFEMYPPTYSASNSEYTIVLLRLSLLGPPVGNQELPDGVNVDFQVQAMIGYFTRDNYGYIILTGQSSDWSNTQSITIGKISASTSPNPTPSSNPTPNPTPTPTVPEFSWLAILPLCVSMVFVAVYLKHRRTNHE